MAVLNLLPDFQGCVFTLPCWVLPCCSLHFAHGLCTGEAFPKPVPTRQRSRGLCWVQAPAAFASGLCEHSAGLIPLPSMSPPGRGRWVLKVTLSEQGDLCVPLQLLFPK